METIFQVCGFLFRARPGFIHQRSQSLETESRVSSANSLTSGWISCCSTPAARHQPVLCFSSTGSPLQFYVDAINSGHVTAYGPGLTHGTVNRPATFTIVTKDAGEGTNTLTCNIQVSVICSKFKLYFTSKTKRKTSSSRRSRSKDQLFYPFIQRYFCENPSCFLIHSAKTQSLQTTNYKLQLYVFITKTCLSSLSLFLSITTKSFCSTER